jgi:acyl carrier protein
MLQLENEIKALIIEALNLEDVKPDQIDTNAPLFGEGLGLDSIDALELGLAVKRRYGILLDADNGETRKHFSSVASLVQLVSTSRSV